MAGLPAALAALTPAEWASLKAGTQSRLEEKPTSIGERAERLYGEAYLHGGEWGRAQASLGDRLFKHPFSFVGADANPSLFAGEDAVLIRCRRGCVEVERTSADGPARGHLLWVLVFDGSAVRTVRRGRTQAAGRRA